MRRLLLITILFLGGCATASFWTTLPQGQFQDKKSAFEASVPQGWMHLDMSPYFIITKDGTSLNLIMVVRQSVDVKSDGSQKIFEKNMTPQELAEVEKSYLEADSDLLKLHFLKNELAHIDGHDTAFLEYKCVTDDGLILKGQVYTFLHGRQVYRIKYQAPEQYYFAKYYCDFDKFIKTFKIIPE